MNENQATLVRYTIDAGASTFTVQAFAGGLLAGFGHNPTIAIRDFAGEARFVPGTFADASVRVVVEARSLRLVDDVSDKDRREIERTMLEDVLETNAYPQITFESTSVSATRVAEGRYKARVIANLTLHGVTRNGIWIQAQVQAEGDLMRARGEFTLKQTDYGIKLVSVAGGVIKLKDELKFTFDVVARPAAGGG
jgi:polyisoprenoid-binding protein YceI